MLRSVKLEDEDELGTGKDPEVTDPLQSTNRKLVWRKRDIPHS
jgi:hypothetical protein